MGLQSPLSRVLGLGSAKEGTDHWWAQRLTAAALVLLCMRRKGHAKKRSLPRQNNPMEWEIR